MSNPATPPAPTPEGSRWHIAVALRRRVDGWLAARQPKRDTLLLTQRNIYILPTRAGWLFAFTLVVLLVASINYQLNLGYLLTFLLAGSGFVSMHVTHNQLRGLTLHLRPLAPVFAGDPAPLELVLASPRGVRHGIGVRVAVAAGAQPAGGTMGAGGAGGLVWLDVPDGGQASAHLSTVPLRRGRHDAPLLGIETRFPLGLFRAWAVWRPAAQWLVYPQPERPAPALPAARAASGAAAARSHRQSGGDVDGVRAYQRGDPLNNVVWKKAAKSLQAGGELVSRDSAAATPHALWLDWQACGNLPPEARLSRLAAWVVAADRGAAVYGVALPGRQLAPGHGDAHRRLGLEALALWA